MQYFLKKNYRPTKPQKAKQDKTKNSNSLKRNLSVVHPLRNQFLEQSLVV